jgi:hypothetical protein
MEGVSKKAWLKTKPFMNDKSDEKRSIRSASFAVCPKNHVLTGKHTLKGDHSSFVMG